MFPKGPVESVRDPQDNVTAGAMPKDARRDWYVTDTAPVILLAEPLKISEESATLNAELKLASVTPAVAVWVLGFGTTTVTKNGSPGFPLPVQDTPFGPLGSKKISAPNGIG